MKGYLSILVLLAIVSAFLATFLIPGVIAEHQFGLRPPWPMFVGAASLCVTLLALFRWVIHLQRKERTVLATKQHPIFGEVRQLKDHWEASAYLTEGGPLIEIWGDSLEPSSTQVSTFTAIRERYPQLLQQTIEQAGEFFQSLGIFVAPHELELDGIHLSSDAFGSFDLTYSVPAHEQKLPWGVSFTFHDFAVDEITDNH